MKITFLIGNGFDIALASKLGIEKTGYKELYDWNKRWEFNKNEQRENKLVESIYKETNNLWSDFEDGLISYFNNVRDKQEVVNFFKDKDQFCGYIYDYLKLFYERRATENKFIDNCIDEFSESIVGFINRMDDFDRKKIIDFIMSKDDCSETIHINFVNFNGTNTLELLLNEISLKNLSIKCGTKTFKVVLDNLHYTHSKLGGKTENYHEYAFGTTARNHINPHNLTIPTSVTNILNKTNYSFDEWIRDTDLFITHGLSFGKSDEYYWDKVIEKIHSGAMLIDFPFVRKESKMSVNIMNEVKSQRISRIAKYDDNNPKVTNKIIISNLSSFKPQQDSSSLFSF